MLKKKSISHISSKCLCIYLFFYRPNETNSDSNDLERGKLGFNLPTNDKTKSGQLDNLSVDSYWVDQEYMDEVEKEKHLNPVTLDFKTVYHKLHDRHKTTNNNKEESDENNKNNTGLSLP